MRLVSAAREIIYVGKKWLLPTKHQKIVEKWQRDCGDETLRQEYPLGSDSIVFDLGGYKGQWASDIHSRYGCTVYVFEPVGTFFEAIKKRFENNKRIKVFPFGLASSTRTEWININGDRSSTFGISDDEHTTISIRDLGAFLTEQSIGEIDLMKINIEGAEYELIEYLISTHLILSVKDLQVQFHDFVRDAIPRVKIIRSQLQRTHFLTYQYDFVWENWRRK